MKNGARLNFSMGAIVHRHNDGFTHRPNRPWPRAPRNSFLLYDDSVSTKNLRNCAEA